MQSETKQFETTDEYVSRITKWKFINSENAFNSLKKNLKYHAIYI